MGGKLSTYHENPKRDKCENSEDHQHQVALISFNYRSWEHYVIHGFTKVIDCDCDTKNNRF